MRSNVRDKKASAAGAASVKSRRPGLGLAVVIVGLAGLAALGILWKRGSGSTPVIGDQTGASETQAATPETVAEPAPAPVPGSESAERAPRPANPATYRA